MCEIIYMCKGANTRMRIGYVYAARTCSAAVLWTSICSSIISSRIIVWRSATGNYYLLAIIFFKLGLLRWFHLSFLAMHYEVVFAQCLCGVYFGKQWSVGLVFLLWCIFRRSSDSATAACLWDSLHTEIWWGAAVSDGLMYKICDNQAEGTWRVCGRAIEVFSF